MFNFFANSDAVTAANTGSKDTGTPSWQALFGDWWAVAQPSSN
jgi:hypothetical protein